MDAIITSLLGTVVLFFFFIENQLQLGKKNSEGA